MNDTPTTDEIREQSLWRWPQGAMRKVKEEEFDRWLAAHDQGIREQIADEISRRVPLSIPGFVRDAGPEFLYEPREQSPWEHGWNQARSEAINAALGGEQE